jgi:hypothetical protein
MSPEKSNVLTTETASGRAFRIRPKSTAGNIHHMNNQVVTASKSLPDLISLKRCRMHTHEKSSGLDGPIFRWNAIWTDMTKRPYDVFDPGIW